MQLFLECGKANAYSANIEFNVSAHGEHICENAYSANIEFNVSAHGEHIRERKAPTENSNKSTQRKKTQKKTRTVSYLPVMCSVVLSSHWHLEPRFVWGFDFNRMEFQTWSSKLHSFYVLCSTHFLRRTWGKAQRGSSQVLPILWCCSNASASIKRQVYRELRKYCVMFRLLLSLTNFSQQTMHGTLAHTCVAKRSRAPVTWLVSSCNTQHRIP
jgi:hypothetical protein